MCDVGKAVTRALTPSEKQTQFVRAVGETFISPLAAAGAFTSTAGAPMVGANPQWQPATAGYPGPAAGGGGSDTMMPLLLIGGAVAVGAVLLMQ